MVEIQGSVEGLGWSFAPSPKLAAASSRTVLPAVTEERLRAAVRALPISRVSDLTPLDRVRLPVFSAVTPLARDLTTHLGKGVDAQSARVSALMEAVERVSAEAPPPGSTLRASFAELARRGRRPVAPEILDLPSDTSYAPDCELTWMESWDLLSGEPVLLPADLVLSPPSEGVLREVDTNGLASGNTRLEAIVHALCEVIERDAQGQIEFLARFADPLDPRPWFPPVDLESLPKEASGWVARLRSQGFEVLIQDMTGDLGIPTFRTTLSDFSYPSPEGLITVSSLGWGTALHSGAALLRSLTEAVQTRVGFIQAARDALNRTQVGSRAATRGDHLRHLLPARSIPFAAIPSFATLDLREDLDLLLKRLSATGIRQVIVTDLTRRDLDIPVVRARVPGLTSFSVNHRRVGWRCLRHLL